MSVVIPNGVLNIAYNSTLTLLKLLEIAMEAQDNGDNIGDDKKALEQLDETKDKVVGLLASIHFVPAVEVADDT